jgi:hypothetical protein
VGNAPSPAGGIIQLTGGSATGLDTITFSAPVLNPVMAIWSLGRTYLPVQLDFGSQLFTVEASGPSNEYGGSGITALGNNVLGLEGNGTIQFQGLYSSISFATPNEEYWYGFTVGNDIGGVPEPATWAMFLLGFGAIGWTLRGRRNTAVGATTA